MALASYPGFFMTHVPPGEQQIGVYWPALVPSADVEQRVVIGEADDRRCRRPRLPPPRAPRVRAGSARRTGAGRRVARDVPLGTICGARSGDKGGNANVGVWVRTPEAYRWLADFLTVERLRALLPEAATLEVERHELPNLLALNFVAEGTARRRRGRVAAQRSAGEEPRRVRAGEGRARSRKRCSTGEGLPQGRIPHTQERFLLSTEGTEWLHTCNSRLRSSAARPSSTASSRTWPCPTTRASTSSSFSIRSTSPSSVRPRSSRSTTAPTSSARSAARSWARRWTASSRTWPGSTRPARKAASRESPSRCSPT